MSDLEQQCEEIRSKQVRRAMIADIWRGDSSDVREINTLLAYIDELKSANQHLREGMENLAGKVVELQQRIAELRRPSDAKEIQRAHEWLYGTAHTTSGPTQLARIHMENLVLALAESQRLLKKAQELHTQYHSAWVTEREEKENLHYKLAESQRECKKQMQWSDEQYIALQSIAVLAEDSTDDLEGANRTECPAEIAKSIKFRFEQLQVDVDNFRRIALTAEGQLDKSQQLLRESQRECARLQVTVKDQQQRIGLLGEQKLDLENNLSDQQKWARGEIDSVKAQLREHTAKRIELEREIARLSSPPEERMDIVERRAGRLKCYLPVGEQMQADLDTLLQDCARYRNAHAIVMGERDAARERCQELENRLAKAATTIAWNYPAKCPWTKREFFMLIEHPEMGMVPTYGGPFDSFTIPTPDDDGDLRCERYDHDRGGWIDGGEPLPQCVVNEQEYFALTERVDLLTDERDAARDTAKEWHQTAIERAERITALEVKCALFAASEKKAEEELEARDAPLTKMQWFASQQGQCALSRLKKIEELEARLAAHDACLTQVREEMPEVEEIRQWGEIGKGVYNSAQIKKLLAAIDKLQATEGANRNAIAVHLARIADLERRLGLQHKQVEFLEDVDSATSHRLNLNQSMLEAALAERDTARDCLLQAQNAAIEISEKLCAAEARERGLIDHIKWLLPMAKGYAAANRVGQNQQICKDAEAAIAAQPAAVGREDNNA